VRLGTFFQNTAMTRNRPEPDTIFGDTAIADDDPAFAVDRLAPDSRFGASRPDAAGAREAAPKTPAAARAAAPARPAPSPRPAAVAPAVAAPTPAAVARAPQAAHPPGTAPASGKARAGARAQTPRRGELAGLLALLVVGLAIAVAVAGFDRWQTGREALVVAALADGTIESQKLGRAALLAPASGETALVALRRSRQALAGLVTRFDAPAAGPQGEPIALSEAVAPGLEPLRAAWKRLDDLAGRFVALDPAASEAIAGQASALDREAEALRLRFDDMRARAVVDPDDRLWRLWLALGGVMLAASAGLGLLRAWRVEARARAQEVEHRLREAERLEQDAKQANDQNQAAILRLMNELQGVADGDLTVQATVSEDITGAIADSVNYTVEELRSLVSRINATAEMVNEASSQAQMIASSLQTASEQQSREIRDTGESVLRMAQQINEVSARAAESANVARHSLSASQEGARAVHTAIAGMNGIRDHIQETAKRIKRLGESSQEIGEIVELISDLTEQTNVLALNAAIQAASAGEAGRGFTVVAEEVQRLAERSAEATRQIAGLIKTIQTDTQNAVAAMERSTQGVVEGTRLSDDAGRALGEIGRVSTHLAELIEDFSNTTSRQAASAGTVAQSIQRILLVTEQTSEGTLQTAGSIRQLAELAQELKSSVSRFKVA